jgi:hypothetical protein
MAPIRPGEEWGSPATDAPELDVAGGDPELAQAVTSAPAGVLVRFRPSPESDLARCVGLRLTSGTRELPMDALAVRLDDGGTLLAVNMVVVGVPPDRLGRGSPRADISVVVDGHECWTGPATTVVVATGQFLRGLDLAPRGHPGDGRVEVQVYALDPRERRKMRARLPSGEHLPHPNITQRSGRRIEIRADQPLALEPDGQTWGSAPKLAIDVAEGAYRLLV